MRPTDDFPLDPELAELAQALVAEPPRMDAEFAAALDQRLARRHSRRSLVWRRRSWWVWSPAAGLAACLLVAVVIVATEGNNPPGHTLTAVAPGAPAVKAPLREPSATSAPSSGVVAAAQPRALAAPAPSSGAAPAAPLLQPPSNGGKVIQSAQLALTVAPERIETVAQEVYAVIGQARGVVNNSTVTASGPDGSYAQFQLSVPSAALPQTMAALSGLKYAQVASRTDTTQDVSDEYQREVRALADARALRTSLLRQLAGAKTQAEVDSLTARLHDAEASISSDQATLARLNHQVDFTQITLAINTDSAVPPATDRGGFTLGKALHTAGRVLTVAAGVLLIAAAGLVPLAALVALALWVATLLRRQRREQALERA